MDLTKIDKPFGELDDATKGAMMLADHRGEVIEVQDGGLTFSACDRPSWFDDLIYRVKPKPVIGEVILHGILDADSPIYPKRLRAYRMYKERLDITFPTRDGQHIPGVYTSPEGLQIKIEVEK